MRWPDPKDYRCPSGDRHDEEYGEMTLVGQKNSWLGTAGMLADVFHTRWKCKICGYEGVNQYAYPAA